MGTVTCLAQYELILEYDFSNLSDTSWSEVKIRIIELRKALSTLLTLQIPILEEGVAILVSNEHDTPEVVRYLRPEYLEGDTKSLVVQIIALLRNIIELARDYHDQPTSFKVSVKLKAQIREKMA